MLELNEELLQTEFPADKLSELAEVQLALVGGGCGTPALE